MLYKTLLPALLPALLLFALGASAQTPSATTAPKSTPSISDHVKGDINRHRAMAQAHEAAARCLESGQAEEACMKALQASCKGLAIGKYCGMRHEH